LIRLPQYWLKFLEGLIFIRIHPLNLLFNFFDL
jgi:hypothetical protein